MASRQGAFLRSSAVRKFTGYLGLLFLLGGAVVLLFLLLVVWQFFFDPEAIFAIDSFAGFIRSGAPPVNIEVDGRDATIQLTEGIRLVLVVLVGATTLIGIASVLRVLLGGGLRLLQYSSGVQETGTGE